MILPLAIAVMVICYTIQSLFSKCFAMHYEGEPETASLVFATIFGTFIAVTTFVSGGFSFSPSWQTVVFALTNAVMLVLFHLSQIGSTSRGSYAISNICMLFGGILVQLPVSAFLLGKEMVWYQYVAIAILLLAFVLLNIEGVSMTGTKKGYWFFCILLFLSNGIFGAVNSMQGHFVGDGERTEMITVAYLGSAILAFVSVLAKRGKNALPDFKLKPKAILFALGCCTAATLGVNLLLYIYSIPEVNPAIVSAIDNGGVLVLTTLAAVVLFKERPTKIQYCGLVLAFGSIVLLNI